MILGEDNSGITPEPVHFQSDELPVLVEAFDRVQRDVTPQTALARLAVAESLLPEASAEPLAISGRLVSEPVKKMLQQYVRRELQVASQILTQDRLLEDEDRTIASLTRNMNPEQQAGFKDVIKKIPPEKRELSLRGLNGEKNRSLKILTGIDEVGLKNARKFTLNRLRRSDPRWQQNIADNLHCGFPAERTSSMLQGVETFLDYFEEDIGLLHQRLSLAHREELVGGLFATATSAGSVARVLLQLNGGIKTGASYDAFTTMQFRNDFMTYKEIAGTDFLNNFSIKNIPKTKFPLSPKKPM